MRGSGCGATMVPDDLPHNAYLSFLYRVAITLSGNTRTNAQPWWAAAGKLALLEPQQRDYSRLRAPLAHNTPRQAAQHRREVSIFL
jgi:hypothetical protein